MPYLQSHLVLRIHGHFGAAGSFLDYWSVGLRLARLLGAPAPVADYTAFLESISGPVSTFHSSGTALAGTTCFLDRLTIARVGTDGKYDPPTQETTIREYTPVIAGGGSGNAPWTQAICYSLRTDRPRGYASNGRVYYPATAAVVNPATGQMGTSVESAANLFRTMLIAINTAAASLDADLKVSVMSQVGVGLTRPVTNVRVDHHLDRQERRENDSPPAYFVTAAL